MSSPASALDSTYQFLQSLLDEMTAPSEITALVTAMELIIPDAKKKRARLELSQLQASAEASRIEQAGKRKPALVVRTLTEKETMELLGL